MLARIGARLGVGSIFVAVALVLFTAPAEARNCGIARAQNHYGASVTFRAASSGISCNKAKKALRAFFRGGGTADDAPYVRGWSCRLVRYYNPGRAGWQCRSSSGAVATAYWTAEGD